jgi:hypothetical protein
MNVIVEKVKTDDAIISSFAERSLSPILMIFCYDW